ncbi:MAG: plasmid pRiA4b ORF-3 family protein [Leptolyngbyaceae cyanobacterium MO_188.B28]|nr:plasmid pRiA4b ORF-3 family protein [Leptolyngbyaceae cyanobacterium MO_188.B28]
MDGRFTLFPGLPGAEPLPLTSAEETLLQQQSIDAQHPGAILHDFHVLLEFLSPNGTEVSQANNFLPMKSLNDLNQRLSHPVTVNLKRPQQKSFPYIHGLYLLLRTSGLTLVKAKGKKQRLVIDEAVLNNWRQLNPTEQYFTLLETWLLWSNDAVLGEHPVPFDAFYRCNQLWSMIPEEGLTFDNPNERDTFLHYIKPHHAALFDLFGFITIQPGPVDKGWQIKGLTRSRFGNAMMKVLMQAVIERGNTVQSQTEFDFTYGALQPVFQPFFPQWRQNLVIPAGEFQEGAYIFKVSILKVWRRIAIPNTLTLDDLSTAILNAFEFDFEHLYQFSYKDRFGILQTVISPEVSSPPYTTETLVGDLPLEPGASMTYLYDFGDRWEFQVQLEEINPPDPELSQPQVLATHGEAPQQYWDEDGWNGGWDEEI